MVAAAVAPDVAAESVLERAAKGDPDAFATLWRTHHAALLRYLRTRAVACADDVASTVWIDVGSSISRFNGDGDDFRRWLFTIAHRRSVDELRRTSRRREVVQPLVPDGAPGEPADRAFEDGASLERAIELVRRLPPEMAEAVMLRVVNDLSYADVAVILDTSVGNVRVLVHRGLRALRSKIAVTNPEHSTMYMVS